MDEDDTVKIDTRYATVGDLEAHAKLLFARAANEWELAEARSALAAAALALKRARGDRTVKLSEVADQNFLPKN